MLTLLLLEDARLVTVRARCAIGVVPPSRFATAFTGLTQKGWLDLRRSGRDGSVEADARRRPLEAHLAEELGEMSRDFFDDRLGGQRLATSRRGAGPPRVRG
jgi:hypothetical protein